MVELRKSGSKLRPQLIRAGENFRDPKTRQEIGVLGLKRCSTCSGC